MVPVHSVSFVVFVEAHDSQLNKVRFSFVNPWTVRIVYRAWTRGLRHPATNFTAGAKQELGIRKECDLEETPEKRKLQTRVSVLPRF